MRQTLDLLSTNHARLSKVLAAHGVGPVKGEQNQDLYDLKAVLKAWTADKKATKNTDAQRLKAAQADKAEFELAVKKSLYLSKESVEQGASEILVTIKNRFMVLPERLTPQVHGLESQIEIKRVIKAGIMETLEDLSKLEDLAKSEKEV